MSGFVAAPIEAQTPPPVDATLSTQNAGDEFDRAECFAMTAGPVSIRCDDVSLAYKLPGVRTLDQQRSLALLYNSGTAHPRPIIGVEVEMDSVPDELEVRVSVGGGMTPDGTESWLRADLVKNTPFRVAVPLDLETTATGLHEITVEVARKDDGAWLVAETLIDTIPIVNRKDNPLGAGWSHTADERIYTGQPGDLILLVRADGGAQVYEPSDSVWVARRAVLPDTITQVTSTYERILTGRGKVVYDGDGRMKERHDRFGNQTDYTYNGTTGLLESIDYPTKSSSKEAYRLF